jgi:CheY-like chemotaxis protein
MAQILLIEDDEIIRRMLRLTLMRFGHVVTEAKDGKEGLEVYWRTKPDLIVTDLVMPVKEGIEVLIELREKKSNVKIIAISGGGRHNVSNYLNMAKQLGASKVIAKPFSSEDFMKAVDEVIPGSASAKAPVLA